MQNIKIFFLGDSISKGIELNNHRYRKIESSFYEKFKKMVTVDTANYGRFGNDTNKILKNIEKYCELKPQIVFFQIGGNDCNFNWKEISNSPQGTFLPKIPKPTFAENLKKIYEIFKKHNIKVISLNLPPLMAERFFDFVSTGNDPKNILAWLGNKSKIYYHHESYNKIFEKVTKEFNIDLIDIRSQFLYEDNLSELICEDGMHPSEKGHDIIFRSINDFLFTKLSNAS